MEPELQEPEPIDCHEEAQPGGAWRRRSRSPPRCPRRTPPSSTGVCGSPARRRDGESETSGFIQQRKRQPPPPVSDSDLKEVKIYGPEQRKRDVSEMYQRTQRLYHQLEEVKQQKSIRSRQEASAQNRLKAKEFHKKTLEKLRAKQTHQ